MDAKLNDKTNKLMEKVNDEVNACKIKIHKIISKFIQETGTEVVILEDPMFEGGSLKVEKIYLKETK